MRKAQRIAVHEKYDGRCAYCGKVIAYKDMQVDHIHPEYLGGTDDTDNLNPACRQCNYYKDSFTVEKFRNHIATLRDRIAKPYINRVALDYGIMTIQEWDGRFYFEKAEEVLGDDKVHTGR